VRSPRLPVCIIGPGHRFATRDDAVGRWGEERVPRGTVSRHCVGAGHDDVAPAEIGNGASGGARAWAMSETALDSTNPSVHCAFLHDFRSGLGLARLPDGSPNTLNSASNLRAEGQNRVRCPKAGHWLTSTRSVEELELL
jgi:hypothetical protein